MSSNRQPILSRALPLLSSLVIMGLVSLGMALLSSGNQHSLSNANAPVAKHGYLDLSDWDFGTKGDIGLDGEWFFFWEQLLDPARIGPAAISGQGQSQFAVLPGYWSDDPTLNPWGYATYHLEIILPTGTAAEHTSLAFKIEEILTAYRLWVDSEIVSTNGRVSTSAQGSRAENRPGIVFFTPGSDRLSLTLEVSNFQYRKSGAWPGIVLGRASEISKAWTAGIQSNLFMVGALISMAIYHFILFFMRRSSRSTLYFGLFCVWIVIRVLVTGDQLLSQWLPELDWELARRLEFLTLCLGQIMFMAFIHNLFQSGGFEWAFRIIVVIEIALSAIVTVLPVALSNNLVPLIQFMALVGLAWSFAVVSQAAHLRQQGSMSIIIACSIFIPTVINDILYSSRLINTGYYLPAGIFALVLIQAGILGRRFSHSLSQAERFSSELAEVNQSLKRFVPQQFLEFLKRKSIVEVQLGDEIQRDMTVMFTDIRSFTSLAETMSPRETFKFLNSYLERIGPSIRSNGGFIDKYLGDGVMALFPGRLDDALDAAIAIFRQLEEYNTHRSRSNYVPISIGIAINHGSLILGTVGEHDRMDTTVIADAVNVASRLESLCKVYGQGIIMAESLLAQLANPDRYHWRRLDLIQVRGRVEPLSIIQVYDGQCTDRFDALQSIHSEWETGMDAFRNNQLEKALERFKACEKTIGDDQATQLMISRITDVLGDRKPVY